MTPGLQGEWLNHFANEASLAGLWQSRLEAVDFNKFAMINIDQSVNQSISQSNQCQSNDLEYWNSVFFQLRIKTMIRYYNRL